MSDLITDEIKIEAERYVTTKLLAIYFKDGNANTLSLEDLRKIAEIINLTNLIKSAIP